MAKTPEVIRSKRYYLPTSELYEGEGGLGINPAMNNLYDVFIDFNTDTGNLKRFINQHRAVKKEGISADPGAYLALFCSSAALPGSEVDVKETFGLRQGITNKIATSRKFSPVQLQFYVQSDFVTQDIFNAWLEFISPTYIQDGSHGTSTDARVRNTAAYRRVKYPSEYRCKVEISAFNRQFFSKGQRLEEVGQANTVDPSTITYTLVNAFPSQVSLTPLGFGDSEIMKCEVTLVYEQYFTDRRVVDGNGNTTFQSDRREIRNPLIDGNAPPAPILPQ